MLASAAGNGPAFPERRRRQPPASTPRAFSQRRLADEPGQRHVQLLGGALPGPAMVKIAITVEAFDAIARTMLLGSFGFAAEAFPLTRSKA
jgi:hypothetical protein